MKPILILLILFSLGMAVYFIVKEKPVSIDPNKFAAPGDVTEQPAEEEPENRPSPTPEPSPTLTKPRHTKSDAKEGEVVSEKTSEEKNAAEKDAAEKSSPAQKLGEQNESSKSKENIKIKKSSGEEQEGQDMFEAIDRVIKQIDKDKKEE